MGISGGKKGIDFNDFSNFLTKLRESVQELEFNVLDDNRDGAISSTQFAKSLLSYSNVKDINPYLTISDMEKTGFTKKTVFGMVSCVRERGRNQHCHSTVHYFW